MKKFRIDLGANRIDMSKLIPYTKWHPYAMFFDKPAGEEHYRLLAYLSSQCDANDHVIDIGTLIGQSALALSYNPSVQVTSYDLYDWFNNNGQPCPKDVPNINFVIADCTKEPSKLANASIILLDVDPHDGIQERDIFKSLQAAGFKGILLLDDIYKNDEMKAFWEWVPLKKYDISKYGHWSGTGVVVFDETVYDVEVA